MRLLTDVFHALLLKGQSVEQIAEEPERECDGQLECCIRSRRVGGWRNELEETQWRQKCHELNGRVKDLTLPVNCDVQVPLFSGHQ